MGQLTVVRFSIVVANDSAVSSEQDLRGFRLKAIQMPVAWTAADIGFYARPGLPTGDSANDASQLAFVIQATQGTYRVLTPGEQRMADGLGFARLHSLNHSSLPDALAQAADRTLLGVVEPR